MEGDEKGAAAQTIIRRHAWPQTQFIGSSTDIAIYGGSAGGGKTWALLMEPLRAALVKALATRGCRRQMLTAKPGR